MEKSLGTRMKEFYKDRTKQYLMRRAYTIIRIDGKAFGTFTKGLNFPFDDGFMEDMDLTAAYLCKNISGAKFAYVQSDEISLIVTDFDEYTTQAWFDNSIQKICSIAASMATRAFNEARMNRLGDKMKWAEFDARVFQIPYYEEVENYLIWRQRDTIKNGISMAASSVYSHNELHKKNSEEKKEMLLKKDINWDLYTPKIKRGRGIFKVEFEHKNSIRSKWTSNEVPLFSGNRIFLNNIIPKHTDI